MHRNNTNRSKSRSRSPGRKKKETKKKEKQEEDFKPDPFFKSRQVVGLNSDNFQCFIKKKEVVLVMFYRKFDPGTTLAKCEFEEAAASTNRDGHAYAAVDCDQSFELCCAFRPPKLPHYKLFAEGDVALTVDEPRTFNSCQMRNWVNLVPLKGNPTGKMKFKTYRY